MINVALMREPNGKRELDIVQPGVAAMRALGWTLVEVEQPAEAEDTKTENTEQAPEEPEATEEGEQPAEEPEGAEEEAQPAEQPAKAPTRRRTTKKG